MTDSLPLPPMSPADRVFDTWLEEVHSGQAPPDLTERILSAHAATDTACVHDEPPLTIVEPERPRPASRTQRRTVAARRSRGRRMWLAVSLACAVLLVAATPLIWQNIGGSRTAGTAPMESRGSSQQPKRKQSVPIERRPLAGQGKQQPDLTPPWERRQESSPGGNQGNTVLAEHTPLPAREILREIERQLQSSWQVASLAPSPPAEESIWCRRVYLKLLGRIPTVDELEAFAHSKADDRRADLVERLLHESGYRAEWSEYWAALWANVLIGRQGGAGSSPANRDGLLQFLREALLENRPFDQIVYEVMSATGSGLPDNPNFNGAVNFWLEHDSRNTVRATDWATRVFWGQPLGCVRCHDQINGPSRQEEFWALNAVLRTARRTGKALVLSDAAREPVYYERPDGTLAMAAPRLPDGTSPEPALLSQPANLRTEVARQFAHSPHVAEVLVNRLWAHFLGYGFTRPVDDMAAPQRPTHPELLELLTQQTEAHRYDMQALMQWIALSDAFARSSRVSEQNEGDMPENGVPPLFTHYYTKPLAPEAVYQSLALVAGPRGKLKPQDLIAARRQQAGKWARRMDTDEGGEQALFEPGVQKSWMLLSDPLMRRATSAEARGFLQSVAESKLSPADQVEHLFLAALARKPTAKERRLATSMLQQRKDEPARALEDIWWALLNSNEFLSDH